MTISSRVVRLAVLGVPLAIASGCGRTVTSHGARISPAPAVRRATIGAAVLQLDATLTPDACGSPRPGITGFARMQVRDGEERDVAGELEYELWIENPERLPLAGATIVLSRVGHESAADVVTAALWDGQTSDKARVRMRGIVALPRSITSMDVAAALRERRGALQIRVADRAGVAAGCGQLRN